MINKLARTSHRNTSSNSRQNHQALFRILTVWILAVLLWALPTSTAAATLLYTADTSGAVLVQSRRTVKDQNQRSWQVIAFKFIPENQPEGAVALRLVGFPEVVALDHDQPMTLTNWQYQTYSAADISDRISRTGPVQPHVGQYDLQAILADLPPEHLQLHLATVDQSELLLPIPPALVAEWQRVASIHAVEVQQTCDRFPREARQNPDFPVWINCSL